jgi:hypothetical protein
MKKLSILFLSGIRIIAALVKCSKEQSYRQSLIKEDSIAIENSQIVSEGGLLSIHLFGTISPDGCSSFSHYLNYWHKGNFIIEAWKNEKVDPHLCPSVLVFLDQTISFSRDYFPSRFILKVKQPDGTYLEKSVD